MDDTWRFKKNNLKVTLKLSQNTVHAEDLDLYFKIQTPYQICNKIRSIMACHVTRSWQEYE